MFGTVACLWHIPPCLLNCSHAPGYDTKATNCARLPECQLRTVSEKLSRQSAFFSCHWQQCFQSRLHTSLKHCKMQESAKHTTEVTAGTGPIPMYAGSTPTWVYATTLAIGVTPRLLTISPPMRTTTAAASPYVEELPAVTVPLPSCNISSCSYSSGHV
jgi:hypothetical protein